MSPSPVADLVSWLRVQLDEDERAALFGAPKWRAAGRRDVQDDNGDYVATAADRAEAQHIVRWDPSRGLRVVEAWRLLLDLHKECDARCYVVKVLALPFSDRPGYREEWRP